MIAALLFVLVAVFPPNATTVRIDHDGWVLPAAEELERPKRGEHMWWWSDSCAPIRIAHGAEPECIQPREVRVTAVDARGRSLSGARVVWGTEEMLADLPDTRLPHVLTSAETHAVIAAPRDSAVWVRLDGPHLATHRRRITLNERAAVLTGQRATPVRLRLKGADGKPVVRARLALIPTSCTNVCPERLLVFNDDGEALSSVSAVTGTAYRLAIWSASHAPSSQMLTVDSADVMTLSVRPGADVSARVVDPEGNSLTDAELVVQYRVPDLRDRIRRTARQSADGTVRIGGIPLGPVEWAVSADGYTRRVKEATLVESDSSFGDVVLAPSRAARVYVVDGSGQPVPNAGVLARGSALERTNAEGVAMLADLPRSDVALEISADGFVSASGVLGAGENEMAVELDRGGIVKATLIRESDGLAPRGIRVRVTNSGSESLRTITDGAQFNVTALRPGTVRLVVSADDAQPFDSGTITIGSGETIDLGAIAMKTGLAVRGTIVDESGAPISRATIRALRLDGDAPALSHVLGNWTSTASADDGSFLLTGLAPGAQLLTAAAEGHAERVIPDVFLEPATTQRDIGTIELPRGKRVDVVCRPAKRCGSDVSLLLAGPDFPFLAIRGALADGRATLHAAPPGEILLRLTRSQHVVYEKTIEIGGADDPARVQITLPSVSIGGTVTVGGRRARGGSVLFRRNVRSTGVPIVVRQKTPEGSNIGSDLIGSFGASTTAVVSDAGAFAVEEIEPGEYDVTFRRDGSTTAPVKVTVGDLATQALDLRFEGHEVAGTVVDRNDRAVAATLEIVDAAGATHKATSGMDGRFALLGLAPGRAKVTATATAGRGVVEFDSSHTSSRSIVVRLAEERSVFTVDVAEASGRAAAGVLVFLRTPRGVLTASTDRDGRAEFRQPSAEAPTTVAAHRPGGSWTFGQTRGGESARLVFPEAGGTLIVRSSRRSAVATIFAPHGFPLDHVLPMVGVSTHLAPGASLRVDGLPKGAYVLAHGAQQKQVTIVPGDTAVADFGN